MTNNVLKYLVKNLFVYVCILAPSVAVGAPRWLEPLATVYEQQLGAVKDCGNATQSIYRLCSDLLRNPGNAPFVMHHNRPTDNTLVLFHGLSDSPFFLRSIARFAHSQGYTVIVGLLPGHGLIEADEAMEDPDMRENWLSHVGQVIDFADSISQKVFVGGFSTGGTLVSHYTLMHPHKVSGLVLFSGALALNSSVEKMSRFWGVKWLARLMDGEYESEGPNPYKYASVSRYSATELADVIFDIRDILEQGKRLNLPVFAAHSEVDSTTPWQGVEQLIAHNDGANQIFLIEADLDVCHADVVINEPQLREMQFDHSGVIVDTKCSTPHANPKHAHMMQAFVDFLRTYQ